MIRLFDQSLAEADSSSGGDERMNEVREMWGVGAPQDVDADEDEVVPEGYDAVVWNELPEFLRQELRKEAKQQPKQALLPHSKGYTATAATTAATIPSGLSLQGKRTGPCFNKPCSTERTSQLRKQGHRDKEAVISTVVGTDSVLPNAAIQRWHTLLAQAKEERGRGEICSVFEDSEFPAISFSICGKEEENNANESVYIHPPPPRPIYVIGQVPECYCHALAAKQVVRMNTPNRGREYFRCSSRRCKYFQWLDGDEHIPSHQSQSSRRKACTWTRFGVSVPLVTDYGFRAQDLLQGGVGDCWFMSALAVVAARHDLISRLFEIPPLSASASVSVSTLSTMFPVFNTASAHHAQSQAQSLSESNLSSTTSPTSNALVMSGRQQTCNEAGVYAVRLFLDGAWTTMLLDDQLPVAEDMARRPDIAANFSNLAFCRCGSVETGGQQLWASLVEKAYAKAHGSYQAISGGEISEALLDLTGAPCLSVDFSSTSFRSESLWAGLKRWRRAELPMGCSTDADPSQQLQEVGLYGSHAYSILDVREVRTRPRGADLYPPREAFLSDDAWFAAISLTTSSDEGGRGEGEYIQSNNSIHSSRNSDEEVVRLIQIRNPHGMGEWTGAYSDHSEELRDLVYSSTSSLSRKEESAVAPSGKNDGTFWMDFTHFMQGFSRVDVSLAYRDWQHCRSFQNHFPEKEQAWGICATSYWIRCMPTAADTGQSRKMGKKSTCVTLSALQPTRRGAWCRSNVKKSYRYGNLCLLLVKMNSVEGSLDSGGGATTVAEWSVVAGGLSSASRETTIGAVLDEVDEGQWQYLLLVFCLGSPPSAAENSRLRQSAPFSVRFTSNQPLQVKEVKSSGLGAVTLPALPTPLTSSVEVVIKAPTPVIRKQLEGEEEGVRSVALVPYLLNLSFTQFFGLQLSFHSSCYEQLASTNSTAATFKSDMMALQEDVERNVQRVAPHVYILTLQSSSSLTVLLFHDYPPNNLPYSSSAAVEVSVRVYAKSAIARDKAGLVKDNKEQSKPYNEFILEDMRASTSHHQLHPYQQQGFRYPTRWASYETRGSVQMGEGKLLLLLTSKGVQYQSQAPQWHACSVEGMERGDDMSDKTKKTYANKSAQFMKAWAVNESTSSSQCLGQSQREGTSEAGGGGGLFDAIPMLPAQLAALVSEAEARERSKLRALSRQHILELADQLEDIDSQAYQAAIELSFQTANHKKKENGERKSREVICVDCPPSPQNKRLRKDSSHNNQAVWVDLTASSSTATASSSDSPPSPLHTSGGDISTSTAMAGAGTQTSFNSTPCYNAEVVVLIDDSEEE